MARKFSFQPQTFDFKRGDLFQVIGHGRAELGPVQARDDVARFDPVAFGHQKLGKDAAFEVLDDLGTGG